MKEWFCWDSNQGFKYFNTKEEAIKCANSWCQACLDDDRWSEEVESVRVGKITHISTQKNRIDKSDKLDDEGCDEEGDHWESDIEYRCNYEIKPV